MKNVITDNGAANLALGIVRRAVLDYQDASIGKVIEGRQPQYTKSEVVRFIRSDWFGALMPELDGEGLIHDLRQSALLDTRDSAR